MTDINRSFWKLLAIFGIFALIMPSCESSTPEFNLQGHRGCRGLMPENSIPAFIHAVDLGVQTLELDLAVSAEKELIVSHEPWMASAICLNPSGKEYSEEKEKSYNIYRMTYDQIEAFDCGSKINPRFPDQKKMSTTKPRLADVIDAVKVFCAANSLPEPNWNLEIKSHPEWDNKFAPTPEVFAQLVYNLVREKEIADRCIIQSFDIRQLQAYHQLDADFNAALLVQKDWSPEDNIEELGFEPPVYSPHYTLVTPDLVRWCHINEMKIYPWTVNEVADMKKMVEYGVDGLITDYPDRYLNEVAK